MSVNAIHWARDLRIPKQRGRSVASMKAVLMCLCWYADDVGQSSYPSLSTIQAWSGLNRKAVVDALRRLEEIEIIEIKRSHGRTNVYSIAVGYWLPSATTHTEGVVALRPSSSSPPSSNQLPSATQLEETARVAKESPREGFNRADLEKWRAEYEKAANE